MFALSVQIRRWFLLVSLLGAMIALINGCSTGLEQIDSNAQRLVDEHQSRIREDTDAVQIQTAEADPLLVSPSMDSEALTEKNPGTQNPPQDTFAFNGDESGRTLSELIEFYTTLPSDVPRHDLAQTMALAVSNSREYLSAKEELFLAALRVMNQRHLFGPRFFNEVSAGLDVLGEDGDYDIAARLTNELRVTQQLQTGGSLSARAVVNATEQIRDRIADRTSQSASVILNADIPLLRGAGSVAEESLISAERGMVYATRTFERFRRQFLFNIANDYFDLVLSASRIDNAERVLQSREKLLEETKALEVAGRKSDFEVNEARERVLQGRNSLANARDSYVVQLERFRSRIGLPIASSFMVVDEISLVIPVPELDMIEGVRRGLMYRLDLQTTRDRLDDSRRAVKNARNNMRADLDLSASISSFTDTQLRRAGLQLDLDETDFVTSVTYGLPLDREIERITLRTSIITLEQAQRNLRTAEDNVSLDVRRAIRQIQLARFSLQLQEESVQITERRLEGLDIRKKIGSISTRQFIDASDDLASALEGRERARRDLRVAMLRYLLDSGQFRVGVDGKIMLPPDLQQMQQAEQQRLQNQEEDPGTAEAGE